MPAAGLFGDVFPAEYIDHSQSFPTMSEIGATQEHGAYVAQALCTTCHGADLAGYVFNPEAPPAPNLPEVPRTFQSAWHLQGRCGGHSLPAKGRKALRPS